MIDVNSSAVEVFQDNPREAAQGFDQIHVEVRRKIIADACENIMRLLCQSEDDVAGLLIWELIRLPLEHDALSLHRPARDVNLEGLRLFDGTLALALLTPIFFLVVHARALAVIAGQNFLPHQAGADLPEDLLYPSALASVTLLGLDFVFGAGALAQAANDLLVGRKLDRLALVELLEGYVVLLFLVAAAPRAAWHPRTPHVHPEHLSKDVVEVDIRSAGASRWIEGRHAMCIVKVPLVIIAKNFVCLRYGLELCFGLGPPLFRDFVGMMLQGSLQTTESASIVSSLMGGGGRSVGRTSLAICLLDIGGASRLIDT